MAIDKAILDLPLEVRAEMALREAVRGVYEEHLRLGLPVYVWRDGKVVGLTPDEIRECLAKPEPPLTSLQFNGNHANGNSNHNPK